MICRRWSCSTLATFVDPRVISYTYNTLSFDGVLDPRDYAFHTGKRPPSRDGGRKNAKESQAAIDFPGVVDVRGRVFDTVRFKGHKGTSNNLYNRRREIIAILWQLLRPSYIVWYYYDYCLQLYDDERRTSSHKETPRRDDVHLNS